MRGNDAESFLEPLLRRERCKILIELIKHKLPIGQKIARGVQSLLPLKIVRVVSLVRRKDPRTLPERAHTDLLRNKSDSIAALRHPPCQKKRGHISAHNDKMKIPLPQHI